MKDVFYTILVVWIVWRILNSVNSYRAKSSNPQQTTSKKEGETTVNYVPPKKKSVGDDEGEYVDYEEIK
jgi:hypothetical protein